MLSAGRQGEGRDTLQLFKARCGVYVSVWGPLVETRWYQGANSGRQSPFTFISGWLITNQGAAKWQKSTAPPAQIATTCPPETIHP